MTPPPDHKVMPDSGQPDSDWSDRAALYYAGSMPPDEARQFEADLRSAAPQALAQSALVEQLVPVLLQLAGQVEPSPATWSALKARIRQADKSGRAADAPMHDSGELHINCDPRISAAPPAHADQTARGAPQVWRDWSSDPAASQLLTRRANEVAWEDTGVEGVSIRRLFVDRERNQFTGMVQMSPGSSYPRHLHNGAEECLVLSGDLHVGELVLHAGDYQRAPAGTVHGVQSTVGGCTLLIVSSLTDEML